MKKLLIAPFLFALMMSITSCSGFPWECGPFDEGYTWEKKDHVFMVPFYPDSVKSDTLHLQITNLEKSAQRDIVYSSTLDSFRIITNIRGSYFDAPGTDTIWSPRYYYDFGSRVGWLSLNYMYHNYHIAKHHSQTPQCSPPFDDIDIQKLRIEVPKHIKYVKLVGY